jgi:teichuronic acid biosynthesis glycosyltransferase TuaC
MQPPGCTWEFRDDGADVLIVTNMWPDRARPVYGIFVQRQIASLREEGLRCDVLYVRGYNGVHTYAIAAAWLFLNRSALRKRYRLVHAHAGETALVVSGVLGVSKIASYCGDDLLGHADADGSLSGVALLRRWLTRQSARFCTVTITKSREMEEALPRSVRATNSVIPNGIDEHAFFPGDRSEARRTLGWEPHEYIVIFVATRPHEPRKRLSLAEAAVAEAERELGSIRLIVAENVSPHELPLMMNAADCMLLTSRMEGSPNAVKEALMCNLPVVSTDVGDVADLLSGVTNSVVCPDAAEDLGAALSAVLRSRRRSDGRERSDRLKQSTIAARIFRAYEQAGYKPCQLDEIASERVVG